MSAGTVAAASGRLQHFRPDHGGSAKLSECNLAWGFSVIVCWLRVQGRRRLELFGEDHNIRPGWVTVGSSLVGSNFNPQVNSLCQLHSVEAVSSPHNISHASPSSTSFRGLPVAVGIHGDYHTDYVGLGVDAQSCIHR